MRKLASASLLAVARLLALTTPVLAGGRGHHRHGHGTRVFIGVGPRFWWGGYYPYPYYYYPYYSYPYYSYPYYTPPVVVQDPPVYIQQQGTPAPAAPEGPAAEAYWYYCPSSSEYYPRVATCNEAWIKVPPRRD
jgi:hypothetical protein